MMIPSIEYYYDLAFNDKLESILSKFINNQALLDDGYEYLSEHNVYIKHDLSVLENKEPNFIITSIDTSKYLGFNLKSQRKILYLDIRSLTQTNNENELKKFLDEFLSIYLKVETLQNIYYFTIILAELKLIIEDVKIQFKNKIENHPIFNKIRVVEYSNNYFECKDLPFSFFEKLYDTTYELDLIDDVVISQQDFIDVFTSEEPSKTALIKFIKSNLIVAYYLKGIEPFFNNLNGVTIEKSKCFLNKQNKPLTATDLYAALSRGKDKNIDYYNRIDSRISKLKESYLK